MAVATPEAPQPSLEVVSGKHYAPEGVTYPKAWDALIVLSLANLLVAFAVGILAAGIGYANILRAPATYQSSAVLLMDQPLQLTQGDAGVVVKLNQLRGKYVALVTTSEVMAPAARIAGLPIGQMRGAQRPVFPTQTLTILPLARAKDPAVAQKIAQATAQALSQYVTEEQAATGLDPVLRLSLRIVQDAGPGVKVSPLASRARQVGIVAGGAGVLVAYVGLQLASARRRLG